ncbi:MFS-type transporter SLC18B1-like [Gordionus sp. m RMFG-2023]|uniref:MFS-type transporter SLC18B1-like n=1 Tax=Gordionus sp. m RMFG-2023 TaxID=3053472 RepID=UPI0031FC0D55
MVVWKDILILILIGILDLQSNASFSIISSFFPKELSKIGYRVAFLGGVLIVATSTLAFSMVSEIKMTEKPWIFIMCCMIARGFQGLGCCLYLLAAFVYVSQLFNDNIGLAFGFIETCEGLGAMGGHGLGGWLFMYGGFKFPFIVLGMIILGTTIIVNFVIPEIRIEAEINERRENGNMLSQFAALLKDGRVFCVNILVLGGSFSISYMVAFVAVYLERVNINNYPQLAYSILFMFLGLAYASQLIPAIADLFEYSRSLDNDDESSNLQRKGVISGLYNSTLSLGALMGPLCGGLFIQAMGISKASVAISFCNISLVFIGLGLISKKSAIETRQNNPLNGDTTPITEHQDEQLLWT